MPESKRSGQGSVRFVTDGGPPENPEPRTTPEERQLEEQQRLEAEKDPKMPTDARGPQDLPAEDADRIAQLEDELARARGELAARVDLEGKEETLADPVVHADPADGEDPNVILIHVLEDGFTAQGREWFRGQEIEFERGGAAYEGTKDRAGKSWLELDEAAQLRRWGRVMFRYGPWPGAEWPDAEAAEAERRRARRAPVLPPVMAPSVQR